MSSLTTLLRGADPLVHEVPALDAARDRLRATIAQRAAVGAVAARPHKTRRAALILAAFAVVAGAYGLWSRIATPVFAAVRFEIRLAELEPAPGLIVARVPGSSTLLYLHPEVTVSNDDVADASVLQDGANEFAVAVQLTPAGAERMRAATTGHIGRPVALIVDGQVVMAPVVRGAIGDAAVLTGHYTRVEAERIAAGIQPR
jgi:hypothetical protein